MSTQVGPYRDVLKASSVRGMLQRKARLADVAQPVSGHEPEAAPPARSRGDAGLLATSGGAAAVGATLRFPGDQGPFRRRSVSFLTTE